MIQNLPVVISICFILITFLTMWMFLSATHYSKPVIIISIAWIAIQSALALSKFYLVSNTFPPRPALLIAPPVVLIAAVFSSPKGRKFIDSINIRMLTILHIMRIFVELVLLQLSIHKLVPQLMTFEGRNFDIISGITAPLVFYFAFIQNRFSKRFLLVWNFICLALLLNIVINAVLSIPSPFQKFGFEQPNVAVLYFPFVWLPCCIVPIVLFAHLVSIKQLLNKNKDGDVLRVSLVTSEQKVK